MRKISFLFAFVVLSATVSFANNTDKVPTIEKLIAKNNTSCTVKVTPGGYNVTITNTCNCTAKQACDGAYKIATVLL